MEKREIPGKTEDKVTPPRTDSPCSRNKVLKICVKGEGRREGKEKGRRENPNTTVCQTTRYDIGTDTDAGPSRKMTY